MAWIQINATVAENFAEPLSDAFIEADASSVTFLDAKNQPIFEPEIGTNPVWHNTKVIALFDAEVKTQPIIDWIKNALPALTQTTFKIEPLEDKDWVRAWMDEFKPMKFGDNLWIIPSHCKAPNNNAVNLYLDPGMAFGTGTHPTTSLCLTWLDKNPPQNLKVIDYGCGSGVLALAANKLGAKTVAGTDIDPQAIIASKQNAQANKAKITFKLVIEFRSKPVDLLIANILAGPLKELSGKFNDLLLPQGTLILSGLLNSQSSELIAFYERLGFNFIAQNDLEEWSQLCFQKNDPLLD